MKKIILIFLFVLLFSSCTHENIIYDNNSQENLIINSSKNVLDTIDYDKCEELGFMTVFSKIEGTHPYAIWDSEGIKTITEVPYEQFWLVSKNGELLDNEPFEKYYTFPNHPDPKWWVIGIREGILYPYYVDENTGEITKEEPWDREPINYFEYTVYKYYWYNHNPSYGINSLDGNVLAEPIYNKIEVPFKDRILLFNGNAQVLGLNVCIIINQQKEILSKCFNYIKFFVFNDESYIGIAMVGGDEADGKKQLYDPSGKPMPDGFWFIDKDGNIISERFLGFESEWFPKITSPDEIIIAIDESGNTIEFSASDYILYE